MDAEETSRVIISEFGQISARLIELAARDEKLRTSLETIGRQLLQLAGQSDAGASTGGGFGVGIADTEPPAPAPAPRREPPPAPPPADLVQAQAAVSMLRSGGFGPQFSDVAERRPDRGYIETPDREYDEGFDLPMIEKRARLKATAARWACERRRRLEAGCDFQEDILPNDQELIGEARDLPDCFLWMLHRNGPDPEYASQWETIAGCFEAVADGVHIATDLYDGGSDEDFEESLNLLAESQSALRRAIVEIDGRPDSDQKKVYDWLRTVAREEHIYIPRYLRAHDAADPERWEDVCYRIEQLTERVEEARKEEKQRQKNFFKLKYLSRKIAEEGDTEGEHWPSLIETVQILLTSGAKPSNPEIREALLPILDDLPEGGEESYSPEFRQTLIELDRFLSARPEATKAPVEKTQESEAVVKSRALLAGKSMVLIGGERRQHAAEAIQKAFDLKELIWIATREHESVSTFEPHVAREDVALVVLAIRWSSHSYGDVQDFCRQYDKPLVRLPAGYNPNQIAEQITTQVSDKLEEAAS